MTEHTAECGEPTAVDEARGIDLFPAPQRPVDALGPEQHISLFGADMHGHPDSCCCWADCRTPGCRVPVGTGRGQR